MRKFTAWLDSNHIAIIFTLLVLAVAGVATYFDLPKDIFPNGDFPRFRVIADIGFASLQDTEINVTRPLEEILKTVPDVTRVVSVTERGTSTIDVYLKWGVDLNRDFQFTQNKISQIRGQLPPGVDIETERMTTSVFPMSEYGIWSDKLGDKQLFETVRYTVLPKLIGIDGIYGLNVVGGEEPEIWVKLDPRKLIEYNLDPAAVSTAIANANLVSFSGYIDQGQKMFFVVSGKQLTDIERIGNVVIATRMGKPLLLKDIAHLQDAHAPIRRIVTINGHPGLFIDVKKQQNADGLKVSQELDRRLKQINQEFNGQFHILKWDLSDFVRYSISGILFDIFIAVIIILLIVYYVMNGLRYALPIMCALPIVIIIEFLVMKLLGQSVNIMTLGGLSAAIGIIADNAIVITENYVHFKNERRSHNPLADSLSYILPITMWATLVSIIIFVPLNMLSGLSGLFFRPLAITLSTTIIVSMALAVFFTPVLIKYFIGEGRPLAHHERSLFKVLKAGYLKVLHFALGHRSIFVALNAVLIILSVFVFFKLPNGFLPQWDEGDIVLDYVAPSGSSLQATDAIIRKVEAILDKIPEVKVYIRKSGTLIESPYAPPTVGEIFILLKKHRTRSTFAVIDDIKEKVDKACPDLDTDYHQILSDRLGDLAGNGKPVTVNILGNDFNGILSAADDIKAKLEKIPGLNGVLVDMPPAQQEIHMEPNQEQASLLGLSVNDISQYTQQALYGQIVTNIYKGIETIPIRQFYGGGWNSVDKLNQIPIYTPNGGILPLSKVATYSMVKQYPEIHHKNGTLAVSVNAEIAVHSLSDVIKAVKKAIDTTKRNGFSIDLAGDYKAQQTSFHELLNVLGISIILIMVLLLFIFESYRTALAVFAGTVCSATFVILGLFLSGTEFDVSSFTGMIAVMGIVVNNGILVIDFVERYRREGKTMAEAIRAACQLRFRPVLITNTAAIAGFLPMALNIGHGAEVLQPFSKAMISGLLGSMFFSLVIMPVFYCLTHQGKEKL